MKMEEFDKSSLYYVDSTPEGTRYSLYDTAIWKNGLAFKNIDFSETGLPVIKIAELNNGISSSTAYTDKTYSQDVFLTKGDYVFSWSGNPETSIDIYKYNLSDGWLNQHIFKVTPKTEIIDKGFFFYLMKFLKPYFKKIATNKQTTGLGHVTISDLQRMSVALPPLPTQQKIAAILSSLDDKIELNNKIKTNLEQQIEALLFNYLSKRETTSVKLGDYLYIKGRIGRKGLKKNEYLSVSNYRIINGETLTKSGIDWNKAGYISEERYTESPEIMLQVGDILLSKDGTIGKIGYVDELELPTSVASGIFVIRNNNPSVISTTFIYYLLKSKLFDSFIIARTEGSVIPHLYQKDFMDFNFPLPLPELMNEFEKTTSPMFNQIINNLKENKKLNSLRDSLLPKLMNGEILL